MKNNWDVTFERVHPCDEGEELEIRYGFELEDASFRDALKAAGGKDASYEADCLPVTDNVRWFTNDRYNNGTHEYYTTGVTESRSLHIPDQITPASRMRLARLLGAAK